eukprot:CAMPEP_0113660774 /NCGR_PEP_ID=MMETSP0017_2-20120614/33083_1 /TAXON_ID=2856 /ORGANISM="Cylindrotheca closterium" /LENGTH=372 /DNA_ID=CAMNT_0000575439 /DNA_START=199 /DNA_END=1317 /DNA_ORIENTATION=- /assembly_acc=CAM_ASM_000147
MCNPTNAQTKSISKNTVTNTKWILKRRPQGVFDPEKDVQMVSEEMNMATTCGDDEIVVQVDTLSVDAFIRTMLDAEAYHGAVDLGKTIPALGYGKVVYAGKNANKKIGTAVQCMLGAQAYATVKASEAFTKMDLPMMSPTAGLGLLGVTSGITAYAGIFYVCKPPKKGDTVVITAAAGAVGSIAAQLAKSTGARVIGIAGGSRKNQYLVEELKLDGSIDYKDSSKTVAEQLEETCPNGIDFIYDNVGGQILDDMLHKINPNARVVICGAISQYSGKLNKGLVQGPSNYLKLAERGATMKGFNVMQYLHKLLFAVFGMFWLHLRGKVTMNEHIENGIESFPKALNHLFTGASIGKCLVAVNSARSATADKKLD